MQASGAASNASADASVCHGHLILSASLSIGLPLRLALHYFGSRISVSGTKLLPEKITSPFQLMAAWFSMLVLLVGVLLTAAGNIEKPSWASGFLIIFTSILIVIVIGCVVLMLTKYRPHLQEGEDYAKWLKDTSAYSGRSVEPKKLEAQSMDPVAQHAELAGKDTVDSEIPNESLPNRQGFGGVGKEICSVDVMDLPGAVNIMEELKNRGFHVSMYDNPGDGRSYDGQACIWIGYRLSPSVVIEALKVAVKVWPHLKYLQLSNDNYDPPEYIHNQIFIGGATSTAITRGLSAWSREEILSLDENIGYEEFHHIINGRGEKTAKVAV